MRGQRGYNNIPVFPRQQRALPFVEFYLLHKMRCTAIRRDLGLLHVRRSPWQIPKTFLSVEFSTGYESVLSHDAMFTMRNVLSLRTSPYNRLRDANKHKLPEPV